MERTTLPGDSDTFLSLINERFANANRIARSEENMADFIFANAFSVNKFALEIAAPQLETQWQGTMEQLEWDIGKMDEIADMGIPGVNSVRKTSRRWEMKLFARGAMMSTRLAKDLADNPLFAKHLANHITGLMASLNTSMKSAILTVIMENAMKITDYARLAFPLESPSFVNLMNRWNSRMGALNKGDKSLIALVNETSTMMTADSGTFNSLVICPEMANLTALSSYFTDSSKVGQEIANGVVFNSGSSAYGRFSSVQNVYTAGIYWRPRDAGEARNPMTTQRELGLFYVMADRMPEGIPYMPNQQDIGIFDPTINNFRRFSMENAVKHSPNFDSNGEWDNSLIDMSNFRDWSEYLAGTYGEDFAQIPRMKYPGAKMTLPSLPERYPPEEFNPPGEFRPPPFEVFLVPSQSDALAEARDLFSKFSQPIGPALGKDLDSIFINKQSNEIASDPVFQASFPTAVFGQTTVDLDRFLLDMARGFSTLFKRQLLTAADPIDLKMLWAKYAITRLEKYYPGDGELSKVLPGGNANFSDPDRTELARKEQASTAPIVRKLLTQALNDLPEFGPRVAGSFRKIVRAQQPIRARASEFFRTGDFSKAQSLIGAIISELDPTFTHRDLKQIFPKNFDDPDRILKSLANVNQLRDKNHNEILEIAMHNEMQQTVFGLPYPQTKNSKKPVKENPAKISLKSTLEWMKNIQLPAKIVIFQPRVRYEGNALVFLQNAGAAVHLKYGKLLATWGLESQAQQNDIAISIPLAAMVTNQRNLCVYPAAQFRRVLVEESLRFITREELDRLRTPSGYRDLKSNILIPVIVPDNLEVPPHIALAPFDSISQLDNLQFGKDQPEWIQNLISYLRMADQFPSETGAELNFICSQATHLVADEKGFLTHITEGLDPFGNLLTYAGANDARECGISNSAAALANLKPVASDY